MRAHFCDRLEVLCSITTLRRTFSLDREPALDEGQMKTLYAGFAEEDRELAEEGIADYNKGLAIEDAQ